MQMERLHPKPTHAIVFVMVQPQAAQNIKHVCSCYIMDLRFWYGSVQLKCPIHATFFARVDLTITFVGKTEAYMGTLGLTYTDGSKRWV